VGSLKDKVYKKNPHTLEEVRYNIRREISVISGVVLSAFGQKGKIFSICCSTGDVLLDFVKVVITANLLLAFFTDC